MPTEGTLAATVREALRLAKLMKADGVPSDEIQATLTNTLRAAWPVTREWKYLCASCDDTGLVMSDCSGDATCGRTFIHQRHTFGTPCWCKAGSRFRPSPQPTPAPVPKRRGHVRP